MNDRAQPPRLATNSASARNFRHASTFFLRRCCSLNSNNRTQEFIWLHSTSFLKAAARKDRLLLERSKCCSRRDTRIAGSWARRRGPLLPPFLGGGASPRDTRTA